MAYGTQYGETSIGVGAILSETIARVRESRVAVAIYVAAFTVANVITDMLELQGDSNLKVASGLLSILFGLANIVGGYLVLEAMLGDAGQHSGRYGRRFLAYFGQAILVGLGIGAGMLFLVVPGVIIACRWVIAPALLVGRGERAVEAIGNSWHLTKGHAFAIFLTALILFLPVVGVTGLAAVGAEALGKNGAFALVIVNLSTYLFTALTCAFAVAILRLIDPSGSRTADVFA
jgi:hypothetical protein